MRKAFITYLTLLGLLAILQGCTSAEQRRLGGMVAAADSLMETRPDTALHILQGIDYNGLDEEDKARYGLLITAAEYKLYLPVDTTFINRALYYYSTHASARTPSSLGDPRAASLYYKGAVLYDMGKKPEATLLLKQAEEAAEHSDDELLRNKIYENLDAVNMDAENYQQALEYAKLALNCAVMLKDTVSILRANDHIAYLYNRLRLPDSARAIYDILLPKLEHRRDTDVAYIYANIANAYMSAGDNEAAMNLLSEATRIKPMPNQYLMTGLIHEQNGNQREAVIAYETVLQYDDARFKAKACRMLSKIHRQMGDTGKSLDYLAMADSLDDALRSDSHSQEIINSQNQFEKERSETSWRHLLSRVLVSSVAVVALAFLLISIIRKKSKNTIENMGILLSEYYERIALLKRAMDDNIHRLSSEKESLQSEIEEERAKREKLNQQMSELQRSMEQHLEQAKSDHEEAQAEKKRMETLIDNERRKAEKEKATKRKTVRDLRTESKLQRASVPANMVLGKKVYEQLCNNSKDCILTPQKELALQDYYLFNHHDDFTRELAGFKNPTPRQKTYLILHRMSFTDEQMARLLGVTPSAIRQCRRRLLSSKLDAGV